MEVHFRPELEKKLNDIAAQSGRPADELVQDVVAGYFDELADAREMLDSRYDDLKSGKVKSMNSSHRCARNSSRVISETSSVGNL